MFKDGDVVIVLKRKPLEEQFFSWIKYMDRFIGNRYVIGQDMKRCEESNSYLLQTHDCRFQFAEHWLNLES